MKHLHGLSVLILGLGDSGLAMARWCARHGASVRVADTRAHPPQAGQLQRDVPQATLHHGLAVELLEGIGLVLKSPGLSPLDPHVAPLLAQAAEQGVAVQGELSLFATALAELKADRGYAPAVLAITGTNGKTTTTSLTARLVERAGKRVALAGNIGPTLLDTLAAALDLQAFTPLQAELPYAEDAALELESDEPLDSDGGEPLPSSLSETAYQASVEPGSEDALDVELPSHAAALDTEAEQAAAAATAEAAAEAALAVSAAAAAAASAAAIDAVLEDAPLPIAPPPPPAPEFEHLPQVWVLELSSFQLDGVSNFEPSAAAVLNVTQDHLDWHGEMAAYAAAKARVFGQQAVMVINRDDAAVLAMIPPPQVIKSGVKGRPAKTVRRKVVRFGLDAPQRPGDFGLVTQSGMAWLVRALESDETIKRSTRRGAADEPEEIVLQRLMPADALRIRGRHNAANALAALALATAIGCPLAPMLHGLREYTGEPHRVEHIGLVAGVHAYDDSKGTNVGATVAALGGLGADLAPAKLVVILGGDGKGQDFAPLAWPVSRYARAVALIGRDASAIQAALQELAEPAGVVLQQHATLEDATRWAFAQARSADAVLLSPACASLDMFRNYAHRAQVFIDTVKSLAQDAGEVAP